MKILYAALLLFFCQIVASAQLLELSEASGATTVIAADDGGVAAVVPAAKGCGAYMLDGEGAVAGTLVNPVGIMGEINACVTIAAPKAWNCLWTISSNDRINPLNRINWHSPDGSATAMKKYPFDKCLLEWQHLLALSDERVWLHSGSNDPATQTTTYANCIVSRIDGKLEFGDAFHLQDDYGCAPAVTADGDVIYYVGVSQDDVNMLSLYRYDVKSEQTETVVAKLGTIRAFLADSADDAARRLDAAEICAVRCSADGDVVVFRWTNGSEKDGTLGCHLCLIVRGDDGKWGNPVQLDECASTASYMPFCGDFDVSGDGKNVFFCAPVQGAAVRQLWRFNRIADEHTMISGGMTGGCFGVSASPNGRFCAFIADDKAYRYDSGAELRCTVDEYTLSPGTIGASVPLELHGMLPGEHATLALADDWLDIGTFTVDGMTLLPGAACQVTAESVIAFTANGRQNDVATATFTMDASGAVTQVALPVRLTSYDELGRTSSGLAPRQVVSSLQFNAEASRLLAVVLTDFNGLHNGGVFGIDCATAAKETIRAMDTSFRVPYASQAAFSNACAYVDNGGKLHLAYNATPLAEDVTKNDAPAISSDGATVATLKADGGAIVRVMTDDNETEEIQSDGFRLSKLKMDYDGRLLLYLRKTVDDGDGDGGQLCCDYDGVCDVVDDDVAEFAAATDDGSRVIYKNTAGQWLLRCLGADAAWQLDGIPADATDVNLSANGCWLTWTNDVGGGQAINVARLDVDDDGAETTVTGMLTGASGVAAVSADGHLLAFAGAVTEFSGDGNGTGIYLYRNANWSAPASPAAALPAEIHVNEDELSEVPLAYTGSAACITECVFDDLVGVARQLPPALGCSYSRMEYMPPQDYVGSAPLQIRFWNGNSWSGWERRTLVVDNVNDPPIWVTEFPLLKTAEQGASMAFRVEAKDVDVDNPEPDVLTYSLKPDAPGWVEISPSTGMVALNPPMNAAAGEYVFHVAAADSCGVEIEGELRVTVTKASPQRFTADELFGAMQLDVASRIGTADAWHKAVCGCWSHLNGVTGWQPLSLPGDAARDDICALLGCDEVWVYNGAFWCRAGESIAGGTAFWACLPAEIGGGEICLTPVVERTLDADGFYGALIGEDAPDDAALMAPDGAAWTRGNCWTPGQAAFVRVEK